MKRIKRVLVVLIKAAIVLLVVFYVVAGAATLWFGRQVETEVRAIAARGEPITLADIVGEGHSRGAQTFEAAARKLRAVKLSEQENTAMMRIRSSHNGSPSALDVAVAHSALNKLGPALSDFTAAASPEALSVGNYFFPGQGDDHLLAFSALGYAVRALSTRAVLRSRVGDTAGATDDIIAIARLSKTLSKRQAMIGLLGRLAGVNLCCAAIQHGLEAADFSDEQTAKLCQTLDQILSPNPMRQAVMYERAVSHVLFEQDFGLPARDKRREGALGKVWALPYRAVMYANEAAILDAYARYIELLGRSYRETGDRAAEKVVIDPIPRWATLARTTMPVFTRARTAVIRGQTNVEATKTMLAVERYKTEKGIYPENLSMAQSSRCRIGNDPFSGKPFKFRRQGRGYILYSVGSDLVVNGGKPAPENDQFGKGTDMVWTVQR
ncbi:MAG: hypothetical protein IT209_04270 [Armatimonadetes bacterium]|nr:hypothetical protein [Armatimonadota bacterium]